MRLLTTFRKTGCVDSPRVLRSALRLESLEDRQLLSTCFVTRLTDQGLGKGFRGDLRYCINKVNAEPGPDVIAFTVKGTITLDASLPMLTSEIQIEGPGSDLLIIDGNQNQMLRVTNSGIVRLTKLQLRDGYAFSEDNVEGAAIQNHGTLVIVDSKISNHRTFSLDLYAKGGAIYNEGRLTLLRTEVTDNESYSGWDSEGGGIWNSGELTVLRCIISNNAASGNIVSGGGVYNRAGGIASIHDSTISGNTAESVFGDGTAGGVYNDGVLSITNSTLSTNRSFGGGGLRNDGAMSIKSSTISNNASTLGGGIFNNSAPAELFNSTVTGNVPNGGGEGGGIWDWKPDSFTIRNSVVAGNVNSDYVGDLASSGYNLFGIGIYGTGYVATDILNVDPQLGQLADNGGPTLTHALLLGSPAIDAGDNTDAPEFDQRGPGFPRIVNGTIDIGAFEVQASPLPSDDGVGRPTPSADYQWVWLLTANQHDD